MTHTVIISTTQFNPYHLEVFTMVLILQDILEKGAHEGKNNLFKAYD